MGVQYMYPVLTMNVNEIKRYLLPGRKVTTNLDSTLKSRDITLPTKTRLLKAMVFPVVMYECESWTVKKAECQRTDVFEMWCWRRLLRVPWTARRFNQSILNETDHPSMLDAWDKCSGLIQWDDPEGWDGEGGGKGGSGWGTHVNPWLIHVNVWQKPLQYSKVISLQLIKINENK